MDSPHQVSSRELRDAVLSGGTTLSAHLTEGPGTRIGPYKLLQQIGEGGFGVVFMADQEQPVRRRVALKIIKLGMDTRRVVARFEAERQALAMMDHPNIARVLDAGATESGRPYFVMELVRGVPITEYCDANNLTAAERLELFIPVCRAIQHAHIKGVIHRDIKPSNILVTLHDGKPVPKVIDFGIAKATDHRLTEKTLFTELKAIIGTPAYMSPEQAEMSGLDIDTRTDVYSLGVLLYELLTGTTPFPAEDLLSAGYAEMQRIIREVEPQRPSTRVSSLGLSPPSPSGEGRGEGTASVKPDALSLNYVAAKRRTEPKRLGLLLRGDLDWIAMKALEKDRTRRYETAEAFAADVLRHLSGEPVIAAPPSAAYRIQKYLRRNKGRLLAASVIGVALLIAFVATGIGITQSRHRKHEETRARDGIQKIYSTYSGGTLLSSINERGEDEIALDPLGALIGHGIQFAEQLKQDQATLEKKRVIERKSLLKVAAGLAQLECPSCPPEEYIESYKSGYVEVANLAGKTVNSEELDTILLANWASNEIEKRIALEEQLKKQRDASDVARAEAEEARCLAEQSAIDALNESETARAVLEFLSNDLLESTPGLQVGENLSDFPQ